MIEEAFDKIDAVITVISIVYSVAISLIAYNFRSIRTKIKKRRLKKLLSLHTNKCIVSNSTFKFALKETETKKVDFFSTEEFFCAMKLYDLLESADVKAIMTPDDQCSIDEIHIGGPLANVRVNSIFRTHFKSFKVLNNTNISNDYHILDMSLRENDSIVGVRYGDNNKILETRKGYEDYAFLIKLSNKDFPLLKEKTMHIFFGLWSVGTTAAVSYFVENYEKLYKDFKEQHYFIAFPINYLDGSYDAHQSYIDMSDDMF